MKNSESMLKTEIQMIAKTYLKPKFIFDRCIDYLLQKNVQIPKSVPLTMIKNQPHSCNEV